MTKPGGAPTSVGVHEAKTHLSRLLRLVENGEEIEIRRGGRLVAKLVPAERRQSRELGFDRGVFEVPDDFDDTDEDIIESFYA